MYAIDDQEFTERVVFPLPSTGVPEGIDVALDRALFALHLAGGASYYKTKLPPEIVVESGVLSKDEAAFWDKLYTLGLGEFFYRNDLDFRGYIRFPHQDVERIVGSYTGNGGVLPLGGGKDSLVAVHMLLSAGMDFDMVMFGKHLRIREVAKTIGKPLFVIDRQIDPLLFEWKDKPGVWNGHVPITAYVSLAGAFAAMLFGRRDVILANERSANVGNVMVDGVSINHQYSKSLECERDLQAYIEQSITPGIRYFSLLRPFSELDLSRRFAATGVKYFGVFSSCNRNFTLSSAPIITRWCGKCPKCAFVFVMLASFITRRKMVEMFGEDLLMKESLIPLYRELLGIDGIKPFECVGEVEEVIVAFALIDGRGEYDDSPIMQVVRSEVLNKRKDLDKLIGDALTPVSEHAMPEEYANIVYAAR